MANTSSTLEILLRLKDEASAGIKTATGSLQKMQSNLEPATAASKAFAVGLAAVGVASVAAGAYMVGQARESVAVQKQLEAVLLSTHGAAGLFIKDLNDQATALSKMTNYTDDAVNSAQAMLLTFTNVKGPIFQEAIGTILDMSTALGQDLKSSAIQLGKALNDPIDGVNALRRVGVSFSQEQQDVIKSLVETGRTAEAQRLILKELATEFGGSAKAVADPWIQAKNSLGEAAESIGMKLLPAINAMASAVNAFATSVLPVWIDNAQKLMEFLQDWPVVLYAISGAIIGALLPAFVAMSVAAVTAFAGLAIALAPFLIGGAIIGALVAGVVWLVQNWEMIAAKANEIWMVVVNAFTQMKDAIGAIFNAIGSLVTLYVAFITGLILTAFEAMGIDLLAVLEGIQAGFAAAVGAVQEIWTVAWGVISEVTTAAWGAITGVVSAGWGALSALFASASEPVKALWSALWEQIGGVVTSVWEGIKATIFGAINEIISKVNSVIESINSIAKKGGDALGVKVPSLPRIPKLAEGGIVTRPTLAMIGEGGESEAVIPLSKLGSMRGGSNIVVNITGNVYSSREAALDMANEIARALRYQIRI